MSGKLPRKHISKNIKKEDISIIRVAKAFTKVNLWKFVEVHIKLKLSSLDYFLLQDLINIPSLFPSQFCSVKSSKRQKRRVNLRSPSCEIKIK